MESFDTSNIVTLSNRDVNESNQCLKFEFVFEKVSLG
jgi:hypothetical protein